MGQPRSQPRMVGFAVSPAETPARRALSSREPDAQGQHGSPAGVTTGTPDLVSHQRRPPRKVPPCYRER